MFSDNNGCEYCESNGFSINRGLDGNVLGEGDDAAVLLCVLALPRLLAQLLLLLLLLDELLAARCHEGCWSTWGQRVHTFDPGFLFLMLISQVGRSTLLPDFPQSLSDDFSP